MTCNGVPETPVSQAIQKNVNIESYDSLMESTFIGGLHPACLFHLSFHPTPTFYIIKQDT